MLMMHEHCGQRLTWCVGALQRVDLQGVKHLKVWLLHLDQVVDGAELTGYNWLPERNVPGDNEMAFS